MMLAAGHGGHRCIAAAAGGALGLLRRLSSLSQEALSPSSFPYPAGQPIPETHPKLLAPGELQPWQSASEFEARRSALMRSLPEGSTVVLASSPTVFMAGVIPYPYRQAPDFAYLTGLTQRALAILRCEGASRPGGEREYSYQLFLPTPGKERIRWDGAPMHAEVATRVFGADSAAPLTQFDAALGDAVASASVVYVDESTLGPWRRELGGTVLRGLQASVGATVGRLRALQPHVHVLRWLKSPGEQRCMKESARAAAAALMRSMQMCRPGVTEGQVAATFEYECKMRGAARMAYPSVVASGADACTIHYGRNDKVCEDGDLLLMDAGCELHGYASDITRTWPVSGKFSSAQRDVYEAVLDVHAACLEAARPGGSLQHMHALSCRLLSDALSQLGVLGPRSGPALHARGLYKGFYPHSVGHWLGLDTHDCSAVSYDRPLSPGAALTIEPGLYIPDDEAFGHLRGIGVRIEDDLLITEDGAINMSGAVPSAVDEVEDLLQSVRA